MHLLHTFYYGQPSYLCMCKEFFSLVLRPLSRFFHRFKGWKCGNKARSISTGGAHCIQGIHKIRETCIACTVIHIVCVHFCKGISAESRAERTCPFWRHRPQRGSPPSCLSPHPTTVFPEVGQKREHHHATPFSHSNRPATHSTETWEVNGGSPTWVLCINEHSKN